MATVNVFQPRNSGVIRTANWGPPFTSPPLLPSPFLPLSSTAVRFSPLQPKSWFVNWWPLLPFLPIPFFVLVRPTLFFFLFLPSPSVSHFFFLPFRSVPLRLVSPFLLSPSLSRRKSRTRKIQLAGLEECCKLLQRDVEQSSSQNRIWCIISLKCVIWWQASNLQRATSIGSAIVATYSGVIIIRVDKHSDGVDTGYISCTLTTRLLIEAVICRERKRMSRDTSIRVIRSPQNSFFTVVVSSPLVWQPRSQPSRQPPRTHGTAPRTTLLLTSLTDFANRIADHRPPPPPVWH